MSVIKSVSAIVVVRLLGLLPLSWARGFGHFVGSLAWYLRTSLAIITRQNLVRSFPELNELEASCLAKQSLQETGALLVETCVVFQRNSDWTMARLYDVRGEQLIRSHLNNGSGVLVIAPHLGNWEVLGLYLACLGKVTSLYRPPRISSIDRLTRASRSKSGATLAPTDRKGLSLLLKALKNGEMVGILPDQTPRDDSAGVFAPFFGQSAFTMTLANKLIHRTGCRAVFAYAKRVPGGFDIQISEPPAAIYSDDPLVSATALNRGVELCVRDNVSQYQWEYKRFRKQPSND